MGLYALSDGTAIPKLRPIRIPDELDSTTIPQLVRCAFVEVFSEHDLALLEGVREDLPGRAVVACLRAPVSGKFLALLGREGYVIQQRHEEMDAASLRDQLADADRLVAGVVPWFQNQGALNDNVRINGAITDFFLTAPHVATVRAFCKVTHRAETTLRVMLKRRGLPPARAWLHVARAIRCALATQLAPSDATIASVALRHRYNNHSAYCHTLRRHLGVTATEVRNQWGWEWMLERWVSSWGAR